MAFCGQCGHKNPDSARFCVACGSPLKTAGSAALPQSQEQPRQDVPKRMRVILHKEGTPPPHAERFGGFEKPLKKGGTMGGCLKKLLLWLIGIVVVAGALLYCIGSCIGGSEGGKDDDDKQEPAKFERIMNQDSVDQLTDAKGFKENNGEVAVRAGRYEGSSYGESVVFDVDPTPDGKIAGKLEVQMDGETIRTCVFAYCGNGIYAMYNGEGIYDNPDEYFQALADHETIEWKAYSTVTVTYTGPIPSE